MSKQILEPLGDRILVKQTNAKEKTAGGLIIPGVAQQKPKEATVVAVGPGKRLESGEIIPIQVKPGDQIIFAHYAGQEVEIDNETFLLLGQEEVLARVKEE
jgi:chaperonin GroES